MHGYDGTIEVIERERYVPYRIGQIIVNVITGRIWIHYQYQWISPLSPLFSRIRCCFRCYFDYFIILCVFLKRIFITIIKPQPTPLF